MTPSRKRTLAAVETLTNRNGYAPTYQEIADHCGLHSIATAHKHVQALVAQGRLFHKPGAYRGISLTPASPMCVLSGFDRSLLCPACFSMVPAKATHQCTGADSRTRAA